MIRNSLLVVLLILAAMTFTLFGCGDVSNRPIPLPVNEHWTPPTTQKLEA